MDGVLEAGDDGRPIALGVAHRRDDGVAAPGQLAGGLGAEAAGGAGDQHDVAARPVVLGRRWRIRVQRSAPRAEGAAAPQRIPLLVGAAGPDADVTGGLVADRPAHRQRLGEVDDVGQGGGHAGRAGAGGGEAPEAVEPLGDELLVRPAGDAVGDGEVGRLPVAGVHARLHGAHLDTERADLEPQSLAERLEGELGGRVVGQHRRHDASRQRRDVDDLAAAAAAHAGQDGLDHPPRPERVGVELAPQLLLGAELGRPVQAVAGVVDQHVDAAVARQRGGDDGRRSRRAR